MQENELHFASIPGAVSSGSRAGLGRRTVTGAAGAPALGFAGAARAQKRLVIGSHLVPAGVTTREANDRGFECLLAEDATESYFPEFGNSTLEMIRAQGAIVGWTATVEQIARALAPS
jgi:hypothetical protein